VIDWEKYNRSQAAITGLGFVEVDIKDYEEMRAAFRQREKMASALKEAARRFRDPTFGFEWEDAALDCEAATP
jgi:hypothetical protein